MRFRPYIFPVLLGIAGCAVLIGLGVWQLQRLEWKERVLSDIEARIAADPVAVPDRPDPSEDRFLPVVARGAFTGETARVFTSHDGAGHRIISAFRLEDGRRVMVDEGFVIQGGEDHPGPEENVTVTGNLHWPDDTDRFTPGPDLAEGLFFSRDVAKLAEALGTEPVLIVARSVEPEERALPLPVGTEGIPNNHLGYAIQWFGLAIVWAGMTLFLLWRIRNRTT